VDPTSGAAVSTAAAVDMTSASFFMTFLSVLFIDQ
jgi:hypothetical protein